MIRRNFLYAAIALAAGTVGCAHCDTCSDFPSPGVPAYGGHSVFGATAAYDATPTSMTAPAPSTAPANDAAPPAPSIESKPAAPAATPPKPGV